MSFRRRTVRRHRQRRRAPAARKRQATASRVAPRVVPRVVPVEQNEVKLALLIGCEYISTGNRLPGCHADVVNVRNLLISQFKYQPENITIVADERLLSPMLPTRENIIAALGKFVSDITEKKATHAVLYYSGHGTQVDDMNGDEADMMDEAIVPLDFARSGMLIDDDLNALLVSKLPPTLKQLTACFDSCNSGTVLDLPFIYNYPQQIAPTSRKGTVVATSPSQPLIVCLSGCRDPQTSASAYNLERTNEWQGAMSWSLRQILKSNKYTIANAKKFIDTLRTTLASNKFTQVPQLTLSRPVQITSPLTLF